MTHPDHLRDRARELRGTSGLTIDQIAERLAISRSTVYCWVRDLPIERPRRDRGQELAGPALREGCRQRQENAYAQGRAEFARLAADPTFRDFVCMYVGEGSKRSRDTVEIRNSDPAVVALAAQWLGRMSRRKLEYRLQFRADQDLVELVRFWAGRLRIDHSEIKLQRRSTGDRLAERAWRSQYGVLAVVAHDPLLRARLQGWVDEVRGAWGRSAESKLTA